MRRAVIQAAILATALTGAPGFASAQTTDDWDLDRDDQAHRLTASVVYSDHTGVGTRCTDGAFEVLLAGLPPPPDDGDYLRTLTISLGDEEAYPQTWIRGDNPAVAFSTMPARFARMLRQGGRMQIEAQAQADQPAPRIAIDVPPSPAAINETLAACGRPLEDPRDVDRTWVVTAIPSPLNWSRRPEPDFPRRALGNGLLRGIAVISCVAEPDGRLSRCEVESEHPTGKDLGREAIRAVRFARVATADGSPAPPAMITFSVRYEMEE